MKGINLVLSWVEHEKNFYNLGARLQYTLCLPILTSSICKSHALAHFSYQNTEAPYSMVMAKHIISIKAFDTICINRAWKIHLSTHIYKCPQAAGQVEIWMIPNVN